MNKIAQEVNELLSLTKLWRREEWRTPGKPVKVVWKYVRTVLVEEAPQWLAIFQKDEPHETFVIAPTKPRGQNVKVKFITGPGSEY
jgi:hypothetical protein